MTTTHWSFGVIIGAPATIIGILALAAIGVLLHRYQNSDRVDDLAEPFARFSKIAAWVAAAALTVGMFFGFYPYKAEYHQWRPVNGVVQNIGSRFLNTGDNSTSQRYVFQINGQAYGVDDTRAALVKPGDTVHLSCKREWQWFSVPGNGCRWNG